jgi:carbamoyl-phosphate synthase large subunit
MPRRPDIKKVLVIGSGPIIIGQACEFDYSGTQAIKALKEEGIEVVLLNSNPATIMTDPDFAHRTYLEPITMEAAERIIAQERPDSLLPTMGGQTALNLAKALAEQGILAKYGVRLIGASLEAINKAEDRQLFKAAMERIGLKLPRSGVATSMEEARLLVLDTGYPAIIRPSFTLGGTGGGIAYTAEEFEQLAASGLAASPVGSILIDESILGWKEYELEVVRDCKPTTASSSAASRTSTRWGCTPAIQHHRRAAQTLSDKEYQRDARRRRSPCIRRDRCGHGWQQRAVRRQPGDGRAGRHRDEPARIALQRRWPRRQPGSRSRRSPPSWPSATRSTS